MAFAQRHCPRRWGLAIPTTAFAQDDGEVVVKQFEGGGVYEGTFRNGRQHGQGVYRTPDGYEYSGEWADGVIAGEGTARFADGSGL